MKIFRGPRSNNTWYETDATSATSVNKWMTNWRPGKKLRFDGTIDKSGERHTALGLEVTERDIISLHAGLLRYYEKQVRTLKKERAELQKAVDQLEEAFGKIYSLTGRKKVRAPSNDEMLAAIEEVADHFRWSFHRQRPLKTRFGWLKWKSL